MDEETKNSKIAISTLVPEEVYTDRQEHIDYLYNAALRAISRRTMSTVLLGQRRMGKTEIFKRVVNRLFFDQESPEDIHSSVVPVYFSFSDVFLDRWDFSLIYAENLLRWYSAFRFQDIKLLSEEHFPRDKLINYIKEKPDITDGEQRIYKFIQALLHKEITIPEQSVLSLPRRVSDSDASTIAMFLDEFQNTRLPQYSFDIVGFMQEAVESPTCPHFVTGSAMSILGREILGRGALFGRFRSQSIQQMTEYYGAELALKAAAFYQANISEQMSTVLARRCGGNPFYITAVILQANEQGTAIQTEEDINDLLAVDLSSGFIWGELSDQVQRWIERINEYGISKWILYLAALEENEQIDLKRIQRQLHEKQGTRVELETIHGIMVKLARGDLLEYLDLGGWFRKLRDPVLLEFLKVWGRIEVEGEEASYVMSETVKRYQRLQRQTSDLKGYLAEVYMIQILLNLQGKTIPGTYLHNAYDLQLPQRFFYVKHRVRLSAGKGQEIDIYAAAGADVWIAESKWWAEQKVGLEDVFEFWAKREAVLEFEGPDLRSLQMWFFSYSGFTAETEAFMQEQGILGSDAGDLNSILELAGLRRLPNL